MTGWTQDLFADLTAKIAAELGMYPADLDPGQGVYDWTHRTIVSADGNGHGYSLSPPGYGDTGRIEIHPIWPHTTATIDSEDRVRCTVAADRGPHEIARDIRRKLAPAYERGLHKISAHEAEVIRDQAARLELSLAVGDLMGGGQDVRGADHAQSWHSTHLNLAGPHYRGMNVDFHGDGSSVTLGASHGFEVPRGVALAIIEVWAAWAVPALAAERDAADAERAELAQARERRAQAKVTAALDEIDPDRADPAPPAPARPVTDLALPRLPGKTLDPGRAQAAAALLAAVSEDTAGR